ncbi:hypothetical protein BCR44DRAFT_224524 [Catenaria anguillulae PL171]|uniref:Uncharacterized protein n=1 Tax=Catenaria anguillulae PL171 TaxID=765915 RepID=A0A1Y2HHD8_9FUNG|nr:hypothetical protein BCR44DRAFT_224524 [Catenaria anguillulae PL171]
MPAGCAPLNARAIIQHSVEVSRGLVQQMPPLAPHHAPAPLLTACLTQQRKSASHDRIPLHETQAHDLLISPVGQAHDMPRGSTECHLGVINPHQTLPIASQCTSEKLISMFPHTHQSVDGWQPGCPALVLPAAGPNFNARPRRHGGASILNITHRTLLLATGRGFSIVLASARDKASGVRPRDGCDPETRYICSCRMITLPTPRLICIWCRMHTTHHSIDRVIHHALAVNCSRS